MSSFSQRAPLWIHWATALAMTLALAPVAPAQRSLPPGKKSKDPTVRTIEFLRANWLSFAEQRVAVYPLELPPHGRPLPPQPADYFVQALLDAGNVAGATHRTDLPWTRKPPHEQAAASDEQKLAWITADARRGNFDRALFGRVNKLYRTPEQGLVSDVVMWVVDADPPPSPTVPWRSARPALQLSRVGEEDDAPVLWYGRMTLIWSGRYPLEDCLLRMAASFVRVWEPPRHGEPRND